MNIISTLTLYFQLIKFTENEQNNQKIILFQVPLVIPILVLIVSMYLTIAPIIDKPQIEYLYTMIFLLIGVVFYIPFVKHQYTPAFISKYTIEKMGKKKNSLIRKN